MTLFKTIIIVLILFIAIGVGANFYYPQRVSNVLSALTGQIPANSNETKCPETVPVFCETPAPPPQKALSLLEMAANACRIFGTFKIGDFNNIEQLMPEFSEGYKTNMTNWIASQKNTNPANSGFDSILTNPVEGKTVFSDEKNGQIIILTDRTKIKDNIKQGSSSENCLVNFRKNSAKWEIENIIFSKID